MRVCLNLNTEKSSEHVAISRVNKSSCFISFKSAPSYIMKFEAEKPINPIQVGGGKKMPPISFLPVTSTNVGIIPKNFLTFSFNLFSTLVQNFKAISNASSKLLNLNQEHFSKKKGFSRQILTKLRL